jgi:hypothetical protein
MQQQVLQCCTQRPLSDTHHPTFLVLACVLQDLSWHVMRPIWLILVWTAWPRQRLRMRHIRPALLLGHSSIPAAEGCRLCLRLLRLLLLRRLVLLCFICRSLLQRQLHDRLHTS